MLDRKLAHRPLLGLASQDDNFRLDLTEPEWANGLGLLIRFAPGTTVEAGMAALLGLGWTGALTPAVHFGDPSSGPLFAIPRPEGIAAMEAARQLAGLAGVVLVEPDILHTAQPGGPAPGARKVSAGTADQWELAEGLIIHFAGGTSPEDALAALHRLGWDGALLVRAGEGGAGPIIGLPSLAGPGARDAARRLADLPGVALVEADIPANVQHFGNDPYYTGGQLWGMQGDLTPRASVFGSQAGEAWMAGHVGSTRAVIGVVDSGIDYRHADLYLNIWLNQHEIPGWLRAVLVDTDGDGLITFRDLNHAANAAHVTDRNGNRRIDAGDLLRDPRWANGVDEDGNGYVDDLVGWDFVNNDNDPWDDHGHGTHVAGTIGAIGGNGVGVAGVAWNVQMIPLKFLGAGGSGTTFNAIRALDYYNAAAARATGGENFIATNNSWGGGSASVGLRDAILRGAAQDVLFVAAAGNGGSDGVGDNNDLFPYYPASHVAQTRGFDAVLSVASITSGGALSSFSNFGRVSVDLGAPGSGILSTVPHDGYAFYNGTSMATPHVSGALALFAAQNPNASAAEMRAALLQSTAPTASLQGITVSGGRLDVGTLLSLNDAWDVLLPGQVKAGLTWIGQSGVAGLLPSWAVQGVRLEGSRVVMETRDGQSARFVKPDWIDLTNGWIDFAAGGITARTWLAFETVLDRAPRLTELASITHDMMFHGLTEAYLVDWLLHHHPEAADLRAMNSRAFVQEVYTHALGRPVSEAAAQWDAARLDAGLVSRGQFAKAVMDWRTGFADFQAEVAGGFFTPRLYMLEIATLFDAAADVAPGPGFMPIYLAIAQGTMSLRGLAQDITGMAAFQRKYSGLGEHRFVEAFHVEATGRQLAAAEVAWWGARLESGALARADFMAAVASHLPIDAAFHQLPTGSMFDSVW